MTSNESSYDKARRVRQSGEAVLRASRTGERVSLEDWRIWTAARVDPLDRFGVRKGSYLPDVDTVQRWQERVRADSDNTIIQEYVANRAQRVKLRSWLKKVGLLTLRHQRGDRIHLPQGWDDWFTDRSRQLGDVVVASDCVRTSEFEQHIYPVSADGELRPEISHPDSSGLEEFALFSYLEVGTQKDWNGPGYPNICFIVAEADTPTVIHVGEFRTEVTVPRGEHILQATSTAHHNDHLFLFSEVVSSGRFVIQSHLTVEGDGVDPVELIGSDHDVNEDVTLTFGNDPGLFSYGFLQPTINRKSLTIDVSVLGPTTVVIKEILNVYLFLDDYDGGAYAQVTAFSGHFDALCWEVIEPGILYQLLHTL